MRRGTSRTEPPSFDRVAWTGTVADMLRDASEGDLDRILEINQANVPAVSSTTPAQLEHLIGQSPIVLVNVVDDDSDAPTITGFCIVCGPDADYASVNYQWFMEHHPTAMYLDRVAFDERFRGRGLGSAMYTEVDRRIRQDHPRATGLSLEVNVDPPNEPSLAFHRKLGFSEVGRQTSHGIEVSLMHRPLD